MFSIQALTLHTSSYLDHLPKLLLKTLDHFWCLKLICLKKCNLLNCSTYSRHLLHVFFTKPKGSMAVQSLANVITWFQAQQCKSVGAETSCEGFLLWQNFLITFMYLL